MTADTMIALQMLAAMHKANCKFHSGNDNSLYEPHQFCASLQWLKAHKGRLEQMQLYKQQKYHDDAAYRKAVIYNNNTQTQLKRQDPEYRAHEAALQRRRRQKTKTSLKTESPTS